MKKLIIAVSKFILTVPAFVKVLLRSNYPGRVRSLERPINPCSLLFVVAIVLVVAGCTMFKDDKKETTLSLSLTQFGNIKVATDADGKSLKYDDKDDKRIDSGDNWIATIGACWRKVEDKWGLQRKCEESGEGQAAKLRVTIDGTGKITNVTEGGKSLEYHDPKETMKNSKIFGFNHHCWRKIYGVLKCKHSYC